jgi:hypothetical protein
MKNIILLLFLTLCFSVSQSIAQTHKVTFENDTCLFHLFTVTYSISDTKSDPNATFLKMTGKQLDVPTGKYLNLKFALTPDGTKKVVNGVSVLDLVKINWHILGIELLPTLQQRWAADVNGSGSITTADLVEIRKLILGFQTQFTNKPNWAIFSLDNADGSFQFLIDQEKTLKYQVIKAGDVNGNAGCF